MKGKYTATITFIVCLLGGVTIVRAQKEHNNWYFGYGMALDFNSGTSVPMTGSIMYAFEGSASISDRSTGQLLFYTDGTFVYNSQNNYMLNGKGLYGSYSSTQSALIVPMPEDSTKYYIFTADAGEYLKNFTYKNKGVNYSVVDMNLDGGLGDVTVKNVPLLVPASEKLSGYRHCNGKDIWVVAHGWGDNKFYSWLVTSAGISTPVISSVGSVHTGNPNNTLGYLRISPDGRKLAAAIWLSNTVEVFDFNNSTGIVSNPMKLIPDGDSYGVCFSPDNLRLYITNDIEPGSNSGIFQYNLLAGGGHPDSITASKTRINGPGVVGDYGALQLGPDGKIYFANRGSHYLGVINNPNGLGTACNYVDDGLFVPGNSSSQYGLPNFLEGDSAFAKSTVTVCSQAHSLDGAKPGDVVTIPITVDNAIEIRGVNKITVELHYDPEQFLVLDTPVSNYGIIKNYSIDDQLGKIYFDVETKDNFYSTSVQLATFHVQTFLSPNLDGNLEITAKVDQLWCGITSAGCQSQFKLGEDCIKANQLKHRNTAAISSVYPNPSSSNVKLEIISRGNSNVKIEIVDTFGRVIETLFNGQLSNGANQIEINTRKYSNGIYFCRLVENNNVITKPFNVQR